MQLADGFLGVWHWEYANGARAYTDGCWAGVDGGEPVPVIDFHHDLTWTDDDGKPVEYGEHGELVAGLQGAVTVVLEGGERLRIEAEGVLARSYEPMHRGGLTQVHASTDDGRDGTAIVEVTGSHHHHFFPATSPRGSLPS